MPRLAAPRCAYIYEEYVVQSGQDVKNKLTREQGKWLNTTIDIVEPVLGGL